MNRQKEYTEEGRYTPISKVVEGGSSDYIADEVYYYDGNTSKKVELTYDSVRFRYTADLSDFKDSLMLFKDGMNVIRLNADGTFTLNYPGFNGPDGIADLVLTLPLALE